MGRQYVTRAHRQHGSVVTTIPRQVRRALDLSGGGYLIWDVQSCERRAVVSVVTLRGGDDGGDNESAG